MAKLSETEVREMLRRRAEDFAMESVPPQATLRKARRGRQRKVALSAAVTVAAVAASGLALGLAGGSDHALGPAPAARPLASGDVRLVDYELRAASNADQHHAGTGPVIGVHDLRKHARCMRSRGFDVPDPVRRPGGDWSVVVPAKARELSFRSREFREAWFVACGPLGGPLSGELAVRGSQAQVERFMSCLSDAGFDLPKPRKDGSRGHDDHWRFDLARSGIDTSTRAWNRAMFVTCAPDGI